MHIAYSALNSTNEKPVKLAQYQGYLAACKKHTDTIAAIQQYLPGWAPALPGHSNKL